MAEDPQANEKGPPVRSRMNMFTAGRVDLCQQLALVKETNFALAGEVLDARKN